MPNDCEKRVNCTLDMGCGIWVAEEKNEQTNIEKKSFKSVVWWNKYDL